MAKLDADAVKEKLEELKGVLEEGIDALMEELGLSKGKKEDEEPEEPDEAEDDDKEDEEPDEDEEKGDDEKGDEAFPSLEEIDGLDADDIKTLAGTFGEKFADKLMEKKEKTQREVLKILVALATGEDYDAEEKYVSFAAKLTGKEIGDLEDFAKEVLKSLSAEKGDKDDDKDDDKEEEDDEEPDEDEDDKEEKADKKKSKKDADEDDEEEDDSEDDEEEEEKPKRGRPAGSKNGVKKEDKKEKRRPGRPKKK